MTCLLQFYCKKGNGCDHHIGVDIERCSAFERKPLTNMEYLQSCSAEELADLMSRMVGCSNCPIPKDGRSCMGTYSGCWHEIIKWLKQPHKE